MKKVGTVFQTDNDNTSSSLMQSFYAHAWNFCPVKICENYDLKWSQTWPPFFV